MISITILTMIICMLLALHNLNEHLSFQAHQQILIKRATNNAASEIYTHLVHQQHKLTIYVKEQINLIQDLAENPHDQINREILKNHLANRFTGYSAVTIVDSKGSLLLRSDNRMVDSIYPIAIQEFAQNGGQPRVLVHPHSVDYHLDIMAPWQYRDNSKQYGIFSISIKPVEIYRILDDLGLYQLQLIIFMENNEYSISVTSKDTLLNGTESQGYYFLPYTQDSRITYSVPIHGTSWILVATHNTNHGNYHRSNFILAILFITSIIGLIPQIYFKFFRHKEHALGKSERQLLTLTKQLDNVLTLGDIQIWEFDILTKCFSWSNQSAQLFQGKLPHTFWDYENIIHIDHQQALRDLFRLCIENGKPRRLEHKLQDNPHADYWLEITAKLEHNKNMCSTNMIGIIRNITSQKTSERSQILSKLREKDILVHASNHRIKNHIQGIVGLLEHLAKANISNNHFLENIINQIRSLSIVHNIYSENQTTPVVLPDLVLTITQSVFDLMEIKNKASISSNINHTVYINDNNVAAIVLIINELVFNAIKHSYDKNRHGIRIDTFPLDDQIVVEIKNRGAPLPDNFDFNHGQALGTGLTLLRSLLPINTSISIKQTQHDIISTLFLKPPTIIENNDIPAIE